MVTEAVVDTNVIIDYLRGHQPAQRWFFDMASTPLIITPIVWMEVVQGADNKTEQRRAIQFLQRFRIEHPLPEDNLWAMEQVRRFSLSHSAEFPDVMIASIAVRLDVPLYTNNLKHFAPLPQVDARSPY